jgi:peptide/nickel transport system substrate-binding protein
VTGPLPPQGTNFAHVQNAQYESLVAKAASAAGDAGCPSWLAAESALFAQLDVVPFANTVVPTFGTDTRFAMNQGAIQPSTIRMYS